MASAAFIKSPAWATSVEPTTSQVADWIVREGETVTLAPGRYSRVILDGGRLNAPADVSIGELVFHAGSITMPTRPSLTG
jgi:hypothetical protein